MAGEPAPKRVLFLCTGNSCRSQMAEAIVNARLAPRWQAYSAGTHPQAAVHPKTIQVLAEIGIEHSGAPKGVEAVKDVPFDLVVTVCDQAAEECPVWLGKGKRIHKGYPDPSKVVGSEEAIDRAFREVRDAMVRELGDLLEKERIGE